MDHILSYFGLVAELSVGIIAFQVIAVSFTLTKKDHWNYLDNGRFFALIVCFAGSLILSIIPFFFERFYLSEESIFDFWKMVFSSMIALFLFLTLILIVYVEYLQKQFKKQIKGWGEYSPKLFTALRAVFVLISIVLLFFFFIGFEDQITYEIVCYSLPWFCIVGSSIPFSRLIIYSHD